MIVASRLGITEVPVDYPREPQDYRVRVKSTVVVRDIRDQFFVRRPSIRMLFAYIAEVGVLTALRKVLSRRAERLRNDRYVVVGCGEVIEGPLGGIAPGSTVLFVNPSGPVWAERFVVPSEATVLEPAAAVAERGYSTSSRLQLPGIDILERCVGWNRSSGEPFPPEVTEWIQVHRRSLLALSELLQPEQRIALRAESPVVTVTRSSPRTQRGPSLAVFGYGNYVKTVALPLLRRRLDVVSINEADPHMLVRVPKRGHALVGSAAIEDSQPAADAYLLAGYHHTHAPLAAEVLRRGAWAIIEKPLATTFAQLSELSDALRVNRRAIVCFQKRYDRFTQMAIRDLAVEALGGVDYSCTVYEVPLPRFHWYRWPNSGSRLLSNGCHWIDHFLWLNRGSRPVATDVRSGRNGNVQVWVELENGATFSMLLTERGSNRVGLQDVVDLRTASAAVRIVNSTAYRFEGPEGEVKVASQLRVAPYRRMYKEVAREIVSGKPSCDVNHELLSATTVLQLEEQLAGGSPSG